MNTSHMGLETGRAEDQGRAVVRVAEPQLAEQLPADEGLAQTDDIADVAAAVGFDHRQAAAHRVQLEVGQLLRALRHQIGCADVGVVQPVEGLQVDVVPRGLGDGPGALQLGGQDLADVLGVFLNRSQGGMCILRECQWAQGTILSVWAGEVTREI